MNHPRSLSTRPPNGYATLVATLIMAAAIAALSLQLHAAALDQQTRVLLDELERSAQELAHGCADYVLLQRSYDLSYRGNENVAVAGQSCHIAGFTERPDELEVVTTVRVNESSASLATRVSTETWKIISQVPLSPN